ncbi:MAG: hypothetical protein AAFN70_01420, partial [Planctomycetota bacterium]
NSRATNSRRTGSPQSNATLNRHAERSSRPTRNATAQTRPRSNVQQAQHVVAPRHAQPPAMVYDATALQPSTIVGHALPPVGRQAPPTVHQLNPVPVPVQSTVETPYVDERYVDDPSIHEPVECPDAWARLHGFLFRRYAGSVEMESKTPYPKGYFGRYTYLPWKPDWVRMPANAVRNSQYRHRYAPRHPDQMSVPFSPRPSATPEWIQPPR